MNTSTPLTLRRWPHAAIEVFSDTTRIFVDPGFFGVPDNLDSADAVLVTHDHFDHVDLVTLARTLVANPATVVYSPTPLSLNDKQVADAGQDAAAALTERTVVISDGERFTVGDIDVEVVGKLQDIASLDDAPIDNVGYLIGGKLLHPGDSRQDLENVDTLLVALTAPWQKNTDLEEHLRRVQPRRVIGYHDITLSDIGREFGRATLAKIAKSAGAEAIELDPGETLPLD